MHFIPQHFRNHDAFLTMQAGDWYLTNDALLKQYRAQVKIDCNAVNKLNEPAKTKALQAILPNVTSASVGEHFYCDYGFQVICHGVFTAGCYLTMLDGATITIGDQTRFGHSVVIASVEHHKEPEKRLAGWQRTRPIVIGHHVTIGNGVTILPGANIPDGTVIHDGRVVGRGNVTR